MPKPKPITLQQFRRAVANILLKTTPNLPKGENRQPSNKELGKRYRIARRK